MKNNIYPRHYDDNFIEFARTDVFPIFDLWSIRPVRNPIKEFISGNCKEFEKFSNFIEQHANIDYPDDLIIFVGNGEKNYPTIMYNKTKQHFIVRFTQYSKDYIGTPLILQKIHPKQ